MKQTFEIITDQQMKEAFANANFGLSQRAVLKHSLLKFACGFTTGHTAQQILNELGLLTKKGTLTAKGKEYLYAAFSDGISL